MTGKTIYLVEYEIEGRLEPVAICSCIGKVKPIIKGHRGIVTEVVVDVAYSEGMGVAQHWHFDEESKAFEEHSPKESFLCKLNRLLFS